MDKHLHIICLNVPYPVGYGGVYDLFYKLPALQRQDVKINLHCFTKDRDEPHELNTYCEEVHYYKRNTGARGISSSLPYIVSSRNSEELLLRLLEDDHPVLMEGVHCTYLATDRRFAHRKKFVRIHNVETEYYKQLFKYTVNLKKKLYYWHEARLLAEYEKHLVKNATAFWAAAQQDVQYYIQKFDCKSIEYLPVFIPEWTAGAQEGMGTYCLYHGNLEVEENEYAAAWLLKHVFSKLEIPLVIAGKNPSKRIASIVESYQHTCLVANPDDEQMYDIIQKAHIHVLPSFNNTGIKIKLLNALYNGRHCVVNDQMVAGTRLAELCHVADSANAYKERISFLYHQPFTSAEKEFRKQVLEDEYSNAGNAARIIKWIWG